MLNSFSRPSFSNIFSFLSLSYPTSFATRLRRGGMDSQDLVTVIAVAGLSSILILGVSTGWTFSITGKGGSTPTGGIVNCVNQAPTQSLQVKYTSSPYGGDAAQTSPSAAQFWSTSGSPLIATPGDSVGSLSSAVTTAGSYALNQGIVVQSTATTAYPVWFTLNYNNMKAVTTPGGATAYQYLQDGNPVATAGPASVISSTQSCQWPLILQNIQAPGSGKTATTNVIASTYSSAFTLTYAGGSTSTVIPGTTSRVDGVLSLKQSYKGAMYNTPVFGTQQNPVYNYATSTLYGGASTNVGSVNFQGVMLVVLNDTSVLVSTDAATPAGVQFAKVTNLALSAGTSAYVFWGFPGCTPAPNLGTGQQVTCLDIPFDISQPATTNGHVEIDIQFIDMQQPAYLVNYLTVAAKGSFSAGSAGAAGLASSIAGLVPTSGNNAGAPAILVEQYVAIILCNTGTCT